MLLDLDKQLTDLDGKPIPGDDDHLAKLLAHRIFMAGEALNDPIKFRKIANTLHQKGSVEIDESDIKKLYEFVEAGHAKVVLGAKAEIMEVIEDTRVKAAAEKNK